jgi:hypothetical protein
MSKIYERQLKGCVMQNRIRIQCFSVGSTSIISKLSAFLIIIGSLEAVSIDIKICVDKS